MKIRIYKIDNNGYLLFGEDLFVDENEEIPEGYINTPLPTDEFGGQLPFYRPKWDGKKWIEGATQEEIDELTKVEPQPPTTEQRVDELESVVNMIILGGI